MWKTLYNKLIIISVFAIAMGFLESAVVIYLREIMYPEGFAFPLAPIHPHLALTEILREAATIVMLFTIGLLAAKTFSQRFAWFIYTFAIWDIFYYVFLWILIGWPESLMTWDVLFLIPATWTGPVITPLILTVFMILFALVILINAASGKDTMIRPLEWIGMSAGSAIVIVGFITDYIKHMLTEFSFGDLWKIKDPPILKVAQQYIPDRFPWWIFLVGLSLIIASILWYTIRLNKKSKGSGQS
jgi:hypothetical protein